jgi:hypothetical protein
VPISPSLGTAPGLARNNESLPESTWPETIRDAVPTPTLDLSATADGYTVTVWATSDAARGLKWRDGAIYSSVSDARAAGALGVTSNHVDGRGWPLTDTAWLDPAWLMSGLH